MDAMKRLAAGVALFSLLFTAGVHTQVTDPTAPAPPLRYESAFSDYRPQQETPLLPWENLFTADGDFSDSTDQTAPVEVKVRKPQGGHQGHETRGSGHKVTLDTQNDRPVEQ